ncbi:MAG TPA: hypothetical protein DIS90_07835 [Cytophagales bacterium]|nr:hypothetical protein [Cytophagales bacterium]
MFSIFKRKESQVPVKDNVWMRKKSKWDACVKMASAQANAVFIAWFPATQTELATHFSTYGINNSVLLATQLTTARAEELIIFVEHYPLSHTEQALFKKLGFHQVPVLSSLDEPLFSLFGGEKTIQLMRKMGMKEEEIIAHPMINRAIKNAQQKIASKVRAEVKADSAVDWFSKNW